MVTGLKNSPDAPPAAPVSLGPRRAINEVYQITFPGTAVGKEKLSTVSLLTTGTAYTLPPIVSFTGGGGTGAAAIAQLPPPGYGSGVWLITPTNDGTGYTSAPTVTITPAAGDVTGNGATAIANMQPDTTQPIASAQARFPPVIVPLGCSVSIRGGNGVQPNAYNAYAAPYVEQLIGNGRVQISPDTEISYPCDNLNEIVCAGVPGDGLTAYIRGSAIG
jgi:hypothetical protein